MFRCPTDHPGQGYWLHIRHQVTCLSVVDANGEVDGYDLDALTWNRHDDAWCDCGWTGTVEGMTVEEPDEEEETDTTSSDDANREMELPEGEDWGNK